MPLSKADTDGGFEAQRLAGRIQLTPWRLALAGIGTMPVAPQPLVYEVTAAGTVAFDTKTTTKVLATFPGRVSALVLERTGVPVAQGDPIIVVQSTELITLCTSMVSARKALEDAESKSDASQIDRAKRDLERTRARAIQAGLTGLEVDQVLRTGEPISLRPVVATANGVVIKRYVGIGDTVHRGTEVADIVGLEQFSAATQLHEDDLALVREGTPVVGRLDAIPGVEFQGRIVEIASIVSHPSHAVEVRASLDNPRRLSLREGMHITISIRVPASDTLPFRTEKSGTPDLDPTMASMTTSIFTCSEHAVEVALAARTCSDCDKSLTERQLQPDERLLYWCPGHPETLGPNPGICRKCGTMKLLPKLEKRTTEGAVLAVPATAVIDTGRRKVAYLEVEPGLFEPRAVVLAPRAGAFYPVISGLNAGDRVVSSGAFLLDAETRLNPSISATYFGGSGATEPSDKIEGK